MLSLLFTSETKSLKNIMLTGNIRIQAHLHLRNIKFKFAQETDDCKSKHQAWTISSPSI